MQRELAEAWEQARSTESKPEGVKAEEIGRKEAGDKMFIFYQDENKNSKKNSAKLNYSRDLCWTLSPHLIHGGLFLQQM